MFGIMAATQAKVRVSGSGNVHVGGPEPCSWWNKTDGQHAQSSKLLAAAKEGDVDLVHALINAGASTTNVDKVHGLASSTGRLASSRQPVSCLA
jgi:hypothetical protein